MTNYNSSMAIGVQNFFTHITTETSVLKYSISYGKYIGRSAVPGNYINRTPHGGYYMFG